MCGRAHLSSDVSEIKLVFSILPHRSTPNIAPSWNVAPSDPLPVVRYNAKAGKRTLDMVVSQFEVRSTNSSSDRSAGSLQCCIPSGSIRQ